jgi:hypothetical protein
LIGFAASPAHGKVESGGQWSGATGLIDATVNEPASERRRSGSAPKPSSPPVQVKKTLACSTNSPTEVADNNCRIAANSCPPGEVLMVTWTRTGNGPWVKGATACTVMGADTAEVTIPAVTAADLQRVGLPASPLNLQPNTGEALLNVPLILATSDETITRDTTVLGFPVTIRATPTAWTWNLGDGTTVGPTDDPGSPYPHETLTHTYTAPGDHRIILTTTWSGEYTIAGLPYRPIEGTATTVSAPAPIHVLHGNNVLVAPERV